MHPSACILAFTGEIGLWKFDRPDFKEAVRFLLLNDIKERNENDLELLELWNYFKLKKLIRLQFENHLQMLKWAADLFDQVCKHVLY